LPNRRTSLKGKCTADDVRKRSIDAVEQISFENVKDYLNSEYAKYAKRVLLNHVEAACPIPTTSDFVQARNHVLILMSLTKAQISGVLINFSLSDYDARMVDDKGSVVFNVAEHKTSSTHGTATICVNAEEARLLSDYLSMRYAVLQNFNSPSFFVSHTSKQMTQSTVASALSTAFVNIGIKDRVSCTKFEHLLS